MSLESSNRVAGEMTAIVGGGLAGLTAAATLGRAGLPVTVFESATSLGGRGQTRDAGGYRFNLGPRALYAKGAGRAILDDLGVPYRGHQPPIANPMADVEGELLPLPTGLWSLLTCPWLDRRARFEVARWLARLPKLDPSTCAEQSAGQWLRRSFRHRGARDLFGALFYLTTYCAELEQLSAEAALGQLQLSLRGSVLYLDGGWQTLIDGLHELARRAGVRFETGRRVDRVTAEGGYVRIDTASGESFSARSAVLAVGPVVADRLLGGEVPEIARHARDARPVYAACLDVALRELPRPDRLFTLGIDQPTYLSVHSASADLAPPGGALIHTLIYRRPGETRSREQVRAALEGMLDRVQPGWREHLVDHQLLPKMLVCHDAPRASGDRASHRIEGRPGLFVAGDWVGDAGLLADAAISSGSLAASEILDREARLQAA